MSSHLTLILFHIPQGELLPQGHKPLEGKKKFHAGKFMLLKYKVDQNALGVYFILPLPLLSFSFPGTFTMQDCLLF